MLGITVKNEKTTQDKVNVKQSHYRPGEALRFPGD